MRFLFQIFVYDFVKRLFNLRFNGNVCQSSIQSTIFKTRQSHFNFLFLHKLFMELNIYLLRKAFCSLRSCLAKRKKTFKEMEAILVVQALCLYNSRPRHCFLKIFKRWTNSYGPKFYLIELEFD